MTVRKRVLSLAFVAAAVCAAPAAAQNPTVRVHDRAPCRDPWINIAIRELEGRAPRAPRGSHESGECNIHLYNGARWGSYPELKGYVRNVLGTLGDVRVVSPRGVTDGAGNRVPDDRSQFSGAIPVGNGVTIRFARRR